MITTKLNYLQCYNKATGELTVYHADEPLDSYRHVYHCRLIALRLMHEFVFPFPDKDESIDVLSDEYTKWSSLDVQLFPGNWVVRPLQVVSLGTTPSDNICLDDTPINGPKMLKDWL